MLDDKPFTALHVGGPLDGETRTYPKMHPYVEHREGDGFRYIRTHSYELRKIHCGPAVVWVYLHETERCPNLEAVLGMLLIAFAPHTQDLRERHERRTSR